MITIEEVNGKNGDGEATYKISIKKDGKKIKGFSVYPMYDCPEDATLGRDLGFAYDAIDFFKLGYELGKNNEEVEYVVREE